MAQHLRRLSSSDEVHFQFITSSVCIVRGSHSKLDKIINICYDLEYTVQECLLGKLIKYYNNKKCIYFIIATGAEC
jgi:hypothetical protein